MMNEENSEAEFEEQPSKSQRKREMHALQALGQELTELSDSELLSLELPADILDAVREMHRIRQREARRRHLQFIGKVMRKVDGDKIRQQLDRLKAKHSLSIQRHHQVENWRDQLIEGNKDTLQQFIDEHPGVDIQHLRQLIRMAQKEKNQDKAPAHARKLFRYLRDTVLAHQ